MIGEFDSTDLEAGLQLNLTPNFGIYGGYRLWYDRESSFRGSGSDTEFNVSGPTVGVDVTF